MAARVLGLLGLLFVCTGVVAWAAEVMKVIEREGAIRKSKFTFSPKLKTVAEGEDVTILSRSDPWIQVEYKGVQGWMSASAVVDPDDFIPSSSKVAMETRASEQSAAGRGFTPEVEKEYRKGKPDLDKAFKVLDEVQKVKVADDTILEFLKAGKLVGFNEGGAK